MATIFRIKRNDTSPPITAELLDAAGAVVNLTGATVKFIMSPKGSSTPKVNAAAVVTNPTGGTVSYTWQPADTDTHGTFVAEWECVFADGSKQTFPNSRYLEVQVTRDLG